MCSGASRTKLTQNAPQAFNVQCNRQVFERPQQMCHKFFNSSFLLTLPIALLGRGASSNTHCRGTL